MKRKVSVTSIVFVLIVLLVCVLVAMCGCGSGDSKDGPGEKFTPRSPADLEKIRISPHDPSIAAGTGVQLSVTGIYKDKTTTDLTEKVTYSSSNDRIATVNDDGFVSGKKPGEVIITAKEPKSGKKDSITVKVTDAHLKSLEIDPREDSIPVGVTCEFTATGIFSDKSTQDLTDQVEWKSSNSSVARLEEEEESCGTFCGISKGKAEISASYKKECATANLTVTDAQLVCIEVKPEEACLPKGTTECFSARGKYTDGSSHDLTDYVEWKSGDEDVVTVCNEKGNKGEVYAECEGCTDVTVTHKKSELSGCATVTVTEAEMERLEIQPLNPTVPCGTDQQFTATGCYTDESTRDLTCYVTWESSDENAATISNAEGSKGCATGCGAGLTTIKATHPETGLCVETCMTVTGVPLISIEITPVDPMIDKGRTQQFTAVGTYADTTTKDITTEVTWESDTTSVATISNAAGSKGLAAGINAGVSNITAHSGSITSNVSKMLVYDNLVDFNGDGKVDLACTNGEGDSISVFYRKNDNSGFLEKEDYTTGIDTDPRGITSGDFNGDGKRDIACANSSTSTISVFYRKSDNTGFMDKEDLTAGLNPNGITSGDFNKDGKIDIACTNQNESFISVFYRKNDNSGFMDKEDIVSNSGPNGITSKDFNGDGKPDIACTYNGGGNFISIFYRKSDNTGFMDKEDYASGMDSLGITGGDFNGDGKMDVACANNDDSTISVFYRKSDNTGFEDKVDFGTDVSPQGIVCGDFNCDGKTDLATANEGDIISPVPPSPLSDGTISVLYRKSDNTGFENKVDYPAGSYTGGIAGGDFNGDEKPDLACTNSSSNTITVFYRKSDNSDFEALDNLQTGAGPCGLIFLFSVPLGLLALRQGSVCVSRLGEFVTGYFNTPKSL